MLRLTCVGRVIRDPHTNDTSTGKKAFTGITLVSSRWAGTNPDGTPKYESDFVNCVAFDKAAEALAKVVKGDHLYVAGEPSIETFKKSDGTEVMNMKCVIREWERIAPGSNQAAKEAEATPPKVAAPEVEVTAPSEDDPFN